MGRTYQFYVYILSSLSGTLYIGITDDLHKRVLQHKHKRFEGFTWNHDVDRLLHFEQFVDVRNAIVREKQLKGWRREKKGEALRKNKSTLGRPQQELVFIQLICWGVRARETQIEEPYLISSCLNPSNPCPSALYTDEP
jgi:putative endonuclease